jgi:hypothetical protein
MDQKDSEKLELLLSAGNAAFLRDKNRWLAEETHALVHLLLIVAFLGSIAGYVTVSLVNLQQFHRVLTSSGVEIEATVASLSVGGPDESATYARCEWTFAAHHFSEILTLPPHYIEHLRPGDKVQLVCLISAPNRCDLRELVDKTKSIARILLLCWVVVGAIWIVFLVKYYRMRRFRLKGIKAIGIVRQWEWDPNQVNASDSPPSIKVAYSFQVPLGWSGSGIATVVMKDIRLAGEPWPGPPGVAKPQQYFVHVLYLRNMQHIVL